MRILMIGRKTHHSSPGGDTVQIELTAKYLRLMGVEVDIELANSLIDYSKYDLIHFFNIIRPDDILHHIFKSGLPYVVSTVMVDYSEYERKSRKGLFKLVTRIVDDDRLEFLKALARFVKNGDKINSRYYLIHGHRASIKLIAKNAALLLPNSTSEYQRFENKYGITCRYLPIANAVDLKVFNDEVVPDHRFDKHVLCVGRIEGRKNQLNLIKAMADTGIPLTIIGKPSPNHLKYFNECKRMGLTTSNIKIVEHLSHSELAAVYKAAKVHVLPSWFETTGLSSLEAGVMGCNIVITAKGDTKEYFEDMGYYCDPGNVDSIRKAVLQAYHNPVNPELKAKIKQHYTWKNTAEQTLIAYNNVLFRKAI